MKLIYYQVYYVQCLSEVASLVYSSIHGMVSLDAFQKNLYSAKEEDDCHANELRLQCERGTKHYGT